MRTVLLPIAAAVVLVPLSAHAAPAERVLVFEYSGTTVAADNPRVSVDTGCPGRVIVLNRPYQTCATFDTQKGERTLTVTAVDDLGLPVGLTVRVGERELGTYCGSARAALSPGAPQRVTVQPVATPPASCSGTPTHGTLTVSLSRR